MLARTWVAIAATSLITVASSRASLSNARAAGHGRLANLAAPQGQSSSPCTRESAVMADEVDLDANGFSLSCILVKKGESLLFRNVDESAHTVVSDPGRPGSATMLESGVIEPEAGYPYTFLERGEFGVHCGFHPGDRTTVIVE
jgi:plastocyanin